MADHGRPEAATVWPLTLRPVPAELRRAGKDAGDANEAGLVDRADHSRFAEVFLPHLVDAYRLARWLAGSRADADDIVQEASLRAFKGVGGFAGTNPRAWVLSIVRNAAYTWLARNRPASVVMTEDLSAAEQETIANASAMAAGAVPTPEDALIAKGEAEVLSARVAALPMAFREVLVLREIQELSYGEIAEMIDVPIGTVMSRLARARRLLVAATQGREG